MQESGLLREYCLEEYRDRILVFHRDYATGCGKNTAGAIQFAFVGEHIHWNHVFKFFLHGIAGTPAINSIRTSDMSRSS